MAEETAEALCRQSGACGDGETLQSRSRGDAGDLAQALHGVERDRLQRGEARQVRQALDVPQPVKLDAHQTNELAHDIDSRKLGDADDPKTRELREIAQSPKVPCLAEADENIGELLGVALDEKRAQSRQRLEEAQGEPLMGCAERERLEIGAEVGETGDVIDIPDGEMQAPECLEVPEELEVLDPTEDVELDVGPIAHQARHQPQSLLALRRGELDGPALRRERAEQVAFPVIET